MPDTLATQAGPASRQVEDLTLSFEISDMDAFERDHPRVRAAMTDAGGQGAAYAVVGMSRGNEIRRSGMIDEALAMAEDRKVDAEEALELIGAINQLWTPEEFDDFDWLGMREP